jgi:hypothetical protein
LSGFERVFSPQAAKMSLSGKEDNLCELSYPLLSKIHAGKNSRNNALCWSTHVTTLSKIGNFPSPGWLSKTGSIKEESKSLNVQSTFPSALYWVPQEGKSAQGNRKVEKTSQ